MYRKKISSFKTPISNIPVFHHSTAFVCGIRRRRIDADLVQLPARRAYSPEGGLEFLSLIKSIYIPSRVGFTIYDILKTSKKFQSMTALF
jgi:hypothetical protein